MVLAIRAGLMSRSEAVSAFDYDAEAIDRMDEVMLWLRWLEADEVRLVWLRAEGVRWKAIAHRFGIDRSTAWRRWTYALIKIASRLDSPRATKTLQQKRARQTHRDLAG